MINPDISFCPDCLTPVSDLLFVRLRSSDGSRSRGCCYLCECGALGKSMDGTLNLRSDVAEQFGVRRKEESRPLFVVRKRAA